MKPYDADELMARIRVQLRSTSGRVLNCGPLQVHLERRQVFCGEAQVPVTDTEYRLLALLAREPGQVYDWEALKAAVWGEKASSSPEVHLSNIRQKLTGVGGGRLIRTVRGAGYALRAR
ncbi:response regulator transcription factor [Deinococcus hohokamensis]|uniref:Response regulator transcription factor n=1 Tax=Deinococcus hohokamensis TaxID=309883 RepID=A0ABV9I8W7_9DEIO